MVSLQQANLISDLHSLTGEREKERKREGELTIKIPRKKERIRHLTLKRELEIKKAETE